MPCGRHATPGDSCGGLCGGNAARARGPSARDPETRGAQKPVPPSPRRDAQPPSAATLRRRPPPPPAPAPTPRSRSSPWAPSRPAAPSPSSPWAPCPPPVTDATGVTGIMGITGCNGLKSVTDVTDVTARLLGLGGRGGGERGAHQQRGGAEDGEELGLVDARLEPAHLAGGGAAASGCGVVGLWRAALVAGLPAVLLAACDECEHESVDKTCEGRGGPGRGTARRTQHR